MVNTTSHPRQASIRKIPCLLFLLVLLSGCQTQNTAPASAPTAAVTGMENVAFLAPAKKSPVTAVPVSHSVTPPTAFVPIVTREPVSPQKETLPPPANIASRRSVEPTRDIPNQLPNWRITRLSSHEWRATPARRQSLSDSPPSLMEDAIITSGIHSRLQSVPVLRTTIWKYSSNAGNVVLSSPELTGDQALAALCAVVALDKVSEVHLTTTLR